MCVVLQPQEDKGASFARFPTTQILFSLLRRELNSAEAGDERSL